MVIPQNDYILIGSSHSVIVKIANQIPSEWQSLYTEDDTNIEKDQTQTSKTFGLRNLLESIKKGVEGENDDIIRITYNFKL